MMNLPNHTTYLIDGSGYIFRAFYAVQPLTTKDGMPTNALFGFLRMLLKTVAQADSGRIAVIFDAGRHTFRNDLYSEYKANRTECPPDLKLQMPGFRDLSRALGLPVLEVSGFEADDIIGTLTEKLSATGERIVIVSGDKDLMQLVSDTVTIWDTMKDQKYGPAQVTEKFGVGPDKVVEVLALTGDSSDNVPGVDGVGPKTATQLIQKYQSVEGVITRLAEIKEDPEIRNRKKIGETIESNLEQLRLSRKLVEIHKDVPLEAMSAEASDIDALVTRREPDMAQLTELFQRYEFTSLLKELPKSLTGSPAPSQEFDYRTVTATEFDSWLSELRAQKQFSFDIETTSLEVHQASVVGMSLCWDSTTAYYVPFGHKNVENQVEWNRFREAVQAIFGSPLIKKGGQNIKYDVSVLELNGLKVEGIAFDSMVAAYLLNPDSRSFNLTALASDYLNLPVIEFDEVTSGTGDFSLAPIDAATRYACQDAHFAWLLQEKLAPKIQEQGLAKVFEQLEVPLIPVLSRMERAGVRVDATALAKMSAEFQQQLAVLEKQIHQMAGLDFNINSPKQLADVLFTKLAIPTKGIKKTKTGLSTDSSVLEKLAPIHPLPGLVLEYRMLHKLKSTYTDALATVISPITHRVHTKFNQTITGTGRLSSSEPNLQNIPVQSAAGRRIRSAFVPEEGKILISADYSQIELRLLAHMSGDQNLIAAFVEGADIHARTAREILGLSSSEELPDEMRRMGKTINFGIVYGMGPFRLARDLGISVPKASDYIANYFARYPLVKSYFKQLEELAMGQGEVQTIFGRKRVLSSIDTSGRDQGFMLRAAINAPIQGSAADIIKLAMIRVDAFLSASVPNSALVLQIHDELVIEAQDNGEANNRKLLEDIRSTMESVMELSVPLRVDAGMGYSWQEAQS